MITHFVYPTLVSLVPTPTINNDQSLPVSTLYINNIVFSLNMEKIHADSSVIVLLASILCFRYLETIPMQTFHFIEQ